MGTFLHCCVLKGYAVEAMTSVLTDVVPNMRRLSAAQTVRETARPVTNPVE